MATAMNFSHALDLLLSGRRVAREGWNGKNQWVCYMPPTLIPEGLINGRTKQFWPEGDLPVGGYFVLRTAQGLWQPGWVPSQADLIANDWTLLE